MRFIFRLLAKGEKIANALGKIYTGLLAASAAMEVLVGSLTSKKAEKLEKILKYVNIGVNSLKKILSWLGKTDIVERSELEARSITEDEFEEGMTLELSNILNED